MLLYQRRVYPSATFTASNFLGVRSYASRHPAVVSYITDTLKVAVPSLVSGVATELALTIVDLNRNPHNSQQELERFVLRFHLHHTQPDGNNDSVISIETIEQTERGLRDLVLSVHSLEHGRSTIGAGADASSSSNKEAGYDDSGVSFRLSLHVPEKDETCAQLDEAFATGTWYAPSAGSNNSDEESGSAGDKSKHQPKARVIRPLHQFSEAAVGSIQFTMLKTRKSDKVRNHLSS